MPVFVPFRAFRPTSESLSAVTSKPYDVLNAEEARQEAADNDLSFYKVIKPEIEFSAGQDPFAPEVYKKGKENLKKLIEKGVLVQDEKEHFYVYQIQMGDHTQTGLVGCCSIDDYFNNVIKKHEYTNPKIEASRMKHITTSGFTYEPVFFTYLSNHSINSIINEIIVSDPLDSFTSTDGNKHRIWIVKNENTIAKITALFKNNIDQIYIADGHHRTAAGALAGKKLREVSNGYPQHHGGDLMCVLFPHDQVQILDYNRVVKDLNNYNPEQYLRLIEQHFAIEKMAKAYKPEKSNTIGMYLEGQWYKLTASKKDFDSEDLVDHLSFTILSKQILDPVLNITDLRRDKRIGFVGGIRGLEELERRVDSGEMKVAFSMFPITMEELMEIADKNLILPPKVTWFEPKLRSGIFVHDLSGKHSMDPVTS